MAAAPPHDDEEDEEGESADAAIGYGSLMGLGGAMRKKRPAILLDPVEAENEARRVQFVALQQFVGAEEAAGMDFVGEFTPFLDPEASHDGDLEPAPANSEAVIEIETPCDFEAEATIENAERDIPIAIEPIAEEEAVVPTLELAPAHDESESTPPFPQPRGHRLRARMPTRPPRKTMAERIIAFVGWLDNWLARRRK